MPRIIVNRTPLQAEIIVPDYGVGTVFLERALDYDDLFEEIATFEQGSYIDPDLDPAKRYKYRIRITDVEGSVQIVGDFTFEVPPYYEVAPVGSVTFSNVNETFVIPWTGDITIPLIRINDLRRTKHSRIKFSS